MELHLLIEKLKVTLRSEYGITLTKKQILKFYAVLKNNPEIRDSNEIKTYAVLLYSVATNNKLLLRNLFNTGVSLYGLSFSAVREIVTSYPAGLGLFTSSHGFKFQLSQTDELIIDRIRRFIDMKSMALKVCCCVFSFLFLFAFPCIYLLQLGLLPSLSGFVLFGSLFSWITLDYVTEFAFTPPSRSQLTDTLYEQYKIIVDDNYLHQVLETYKINDNMLEGLHQLVFILAVKLNNRVALQRLIEQGFHLENIPFTLLEKINLLDTVDPSLTISLPQGLLTLSDKVIIAKLELTVKERRFQQQEGIKGGLLGMVISCLITFTYLTGTLPITLLTVAFITALTPLCCFAFFYAKKAKAVNDDLHAFEIAQPNRGGYLPSMTPAPTSHTPRRAPQRRKNPIHQREEKRTERKASPSII